MPFRVQIIICTIISLFLWGCAAHPTLSPVPLKKGQTYTGVQLSAENIFPVVVYRKGLTDISDFGIRLGLPIYGSGIDYSRILDQEGDGDKKYDVINLAYTLTPNANFDVSYLRVRTFRKKPGNALYSGMRIMYIPRGISKKESVRIGPLLGFNRGLSWSIELGYYHDFAAGHKILDFTKSNPINIFNPKTDNNPNKPAVTDFGLPSEYSRLVGISVQFSFHASFGKGSK